MSHFLITLILVIVISLLSSKHCTSFIPLCIRHQSQQQIQHEQQKYNIQQQKQQQLFISKRILASTTTTNTEQETKNNNAFFASTTTIDITDNKSSLSTSLTPYQRIGITEDQLALGVSADEVLKYIGTREQLIEKTLNDIPTLKREQAEIEVTKFYLDAEMINMYIQYGKEVEKDPNFKVPTNENENDDDGFFSFRTLVIAYLGYVSIDSIPKLVRNYIYDLQLENKWDNTNIQFLDTWIEDTTPVVKASREARAAAAAAAAAASGNEVDTSNQSFFEGIGTAITNLFKQVTSSSSSTLSDSSSIIQSSSSTIIPSTESITDAATTAIITVDSLMNNLGIPSTVDTSAITDALTSM